MESRYEDEEAERVVAERPKGVSELLALRTYTARLLGADPALVLHGGGNTSVKAEAETALGEKVAVLHVKGSGWDLATIEPPGHPAVRMSALEKLLERESMTDEQMVNELRLALLDASAPTPSVETLLHAALPARFIDHTHADAILACVDQDDGEKICKDIFGAELLWIPYVMPGFGLARACKKAWDEAKAQKRTPTVMVLERHGIFTFGDTAKESYERMIDAVTRAERYAADRMDTTNYPAIERSEALEARVIAIVRGALAAAAGDPPERAPIVALRTSEWVLAFLERKDAPELTQRGCATPDHVLRTKPAPLFVHRPESDLEVFAKRFAEELAAFAGRYDLYFDEMVGKKDAFPRTKLDSWPRIILIPKIGILAVGKTKKDAEIAADIYEHTVQIITDAEDVGRYSPLGREDLFDVEYWSLEQAKLKVGASGGALPLAKRVAVVTGAASGIGYATAKLFVELGAHVVACDRNTGGLESLAKELVKKSSQLAIVACDVTNNAHVENVFRIAGRTFGGADIVVSNAGIASEGPLEGVAGDKTLRTSMEMNLFSHVTVARIGVEYMRLANRGGCLLFNASKSAFNPGPGFGPYSVPKAALVALMRQYAVDLGRFAIRSNAVNADRIRTNIFDGGMVESRAAARGLTVDDYFRSNLLGREVTARDVAESFAYLAQAMSTTGCVLTVDGGNAAAFPR